MRDCLSIGSTPHEEECAQLGSENYRYQARKECEAFVKQIRRVLGPEPDGAKLGIKSNAHDFGNYIEVVCWFDSDNKQAVTYAFDAEAKVPGFWDDEARKELGLVTNEQK